MRFTQKLAQPTSKIVIPTVSPQRSGGTCCFFTLTQPTPPSPSHSPPGRRPSGRWPGSAPEPPSSPSPYPLAPAGRPGPATPPGSSVTSCRSSSSPAALGMYSSITVISAASFSASSGRLPLVNCSMESLRCLINVVNTCTACAIRDRRTLLYLLIFQRRYHHPQGGQALHRALLHGPHHILMNLLSQAHTPPLPLTADYRKLCLLQWNHDP